MAIVRSSLVVDVSAGIRGTPFFQILQHDAVGCCEYIVRTLNPKNTSLILPSGSLPMQHARSPDQLPVSQTRHAVIMPANATMSVTSRREKMDLRLSFVIGVSFPAVDLDAAPV